MDQSSRPVFWLGDTQWELFRLFDPPTALTILKDRQAKGFNVILIMLTGVNVGLFQPDKKHPPYVNLQGEVPWIGDDPLQPNERYFLHVDRMIRLGEQTGQTFVVGVYHQWHEKIITAAKACAWARWIARRYSDVPNLIWCMYPKAEATFVPVCRELAAGLREGDGGRHLITMHPDPAVASSSFMHGEEWLAFNMIQTCMAFERIHEAVSADYARAPVKPVVMAEGAYEGVEFKRLQTAHDIRKQAWWSQLAGGHHVYGHNDAWADPLQWRDWLGAPGAAHLRVFRDIITSLDGWWEMVPDQSLLASGAGSGMELNVAARHVSRRWAIAYLSVPSTVSLRLDTLAAAGRQVSATWIDPAGGDRTRAGSFAPQGSQSFTTPQGWKDAVLLVESAP